MLAVISSKMKKYYISSPTLITFQNIDFTTNWYGGKVVKDFVWLWVDLTRRGWIRQEGREIVETSMVDGIKACVHSQSW